MMRHLVGDSRSPRRPSCRFPKTLGRRWQNLFGEGQPFRSPEIAQGVVALCPLCMALLCQQQMLEPKRRPFEGRDGGMPLPKEIIVQLYAVEEGILQHGASAELKPGMVTFGAAHLDIQEPDSQAVRIWDGRS